MPNPLRVVMAGYALALGLAALLGLAGWPLVLAFWLGGPAIVLGIALAMPEPRADVPSGVSDRDLAVFDADLEIERSHAALAGAQPVPAAEAGSAGDSPSAARSG